ncbi:MAG TPA: hypothetical protein VJT16_26745 [Streptosporangiaceae bacterium]|nr:hypothetical protein [Streptosporangiaceae bacterium]
MADIRSCEQCGTLFVPRREHARFCSARCRAAWNRQHTGDPSTGGSALQWSITAMTETTRRLRRMPARERPRAIAVISEAVWWVTMVDATLVRHHPDTYDDARAHLPSADRQLVDGTLAGLRFVRNQIGGEADLVDLVAAGKPGTGEAAERITSWRWMPRSEPALALLSPRGQEWEMTRYRSYQIYLAEHTIGATFKRAEDFLKLAAADAAPSADAPTAR